jgi:hypothetical protein
MLKRMKRTARAPLTHTVSNLNLSRMIMMRILMKKAMKKRAMMKRAMEKRAMKKRPMKKRAMMKMEKKARLKMANLIALRIWKRIKKKKSSKKIIRRSHQMLNQFHLRTFEAAQNKNSRRMRNRG